MCGLNAAIADEISAAVSARIDAFLASHAGPILVAFSGGGDSTALLHLIRARTAPDRLIAGIVDHALRPGSGDDARRAARAADALGVTSHVLTLDWPGGIRRAQAALRARRYQALCALAREKGASVIAVGHTADDQAETMLMRAERTGDVETAPGIAEHAPAPVWPEGRGVRLWRPLLSVRREALRAFLRAEGADWIEDPSNQNAAYERVRIRARLAAAARLADPERLARIAARRHDVGQAFDRGAARWIETNVEIGEGVAAVTRNALRDVETARRALSVLITAVSGANDGPPADKLDTLFKRASTPGFKGATLGGVRLRVGDGRLTLLRDPGAILGRVGHAAPESLPLPAGKAVVWDGRLEIAAAGAGWFVRAAGFRADPAAPAFLCDGVQLTLAEAKEAEILRADWLIAAHVRHLLPAFTPP